MTYILLLLFICAITIIYPIKKLIKLRDINLFDILQLSNTLYFVMIPIFSILQMVSYRDNNFLEVIEKRPLTLFVFFLFSTLLLLINYFWTLKSNNIIHFINITKYIRALDRRIIASPKFLFIGLIVFLFALYPIINYSALDVENLEGNLTYRYALNSSLFERILIAFVYNTLPFFLIVTIKFLKFGNKKFKKVAYLILITQLITLLLGTRTFLFFNLIFISLYFYSVNRRFFTKKRIVLGGVIILLIVNIVFPASLLFRKTKQDRVLNSSEHSFGDIVSHIFNMSSSEINELLSIAKNSTQSRSLNVYIALDNAIYNEYESTNGNLFLEQLLTIIPFIKPNESYSNIVGDKLVGPSADIAESVLTYFYFDLKYLGVLLSITFILLYFYLSKLVADFFFNIFKDKRIYFILILQLLNFCINIEMVPSIRFIYNPGVLVYTAFSLIIYLISKLSNSYHGVQNFHYIKPKVKKQNHDKSFS